MTPSNSCPRMRVLLQALAFFWVLAAIRISSARRQSRRRIPEEGVILIPFGRSVNISVTSSLFQLTDQKGGTLPPGNLFPVTVPPGQIPATLVLNLIGIVAVAAPSVP